MKRVRPSVRERIQFLLIGPRDLLLLLVCSSYSTFLHSFKLLSPRYLAWSSRVRGRAALFRAARAVPAYARHLEAWDPKASDAPETDKESYIRKYSTEERCVGGAIPASTVMIDESSGSTGTPYNWVRGARERRESHRFISYFATHCFGREPWITINAFSMGAWATGINMGLALQANSIVKNTGPEIDKILHTLEFFGPKYPYMITGYPPFIKHLIDVAEAKGFPFERYLLNAVVGGEGMSEGLRDYLLRRFQKVYSGYGATDLEIGIAGETPLAVSIRRLARDRPDVRDRLFGRDSRLPMVFQYNPLMHYVEVNDNRELLFTITRSSMLSPRIRYNVHDEGGVARFDEMAERLTTAGIDFRAMQEATGTGSLRLPFLWIYGRRDFTISVMGANIYPEDIEQCLYAEPELARITRSFCLSLHEEAGAEVHPCFLFEIDAEPGEALQRRFAGAMLERLTALNADFREARREYPQALVPRVELYRAGEGPFAVAPGKIKQARILNRG